MFMRCRYYYLKVKQSESVVTYLNYFHAILYTVYIKAIFLSLTEPPFIRFISPILQLQYIFIYMHDGRTTEI